MSDKIKKVLNTPEVPEELKPENIPSLIRRNNMKQKKTRNIIRYVSALTACAVLTVCAVNFIPKNNETLYQIEPPSNSDSMSDSDEIIAENLYFTNISDYNEIYNQLKKNYREEERNKNSGGIAGLIDRIFGSHVNYENSMSMADGAIKGAGMDIAENGDDVEMAEEEYSSADMEMSDEDVSYDTGAGSEDTDVYDTLQQVEGIAEADIIKANAECIFFIDNSGNLISVPFNNTDGTFGERNEIYLNNVENCDFFNTQEMYLTGEILTIIVDFSTNDVHNNYYFNNASTEVLIYDISENKPELIDTYFQSGNYSDSRMKDNILYLTTNQCEYYNAIVEEDNYKEYIPTCGNTYDGMECIDTDDIYIPKNWDNKRADVEYVNIAGIDINNVSEPVSMVSVAGYNGNLYCSNDNIYITQSDYNDGSEKTAITRFSVSNGVINPETSGIVDGYVLNQFSMDEYNGYFRIATTLDKNTYYYDDVWVAEEYAPNRSNNVFVLDMDMNTVGSITGFAETESIKSVTFKGDTGYVVTYEQTDPLFAIDFSDPCNPVITDEFKINGYSSFLYNWSDDLLLGFGIDADERALEMGVKLVMFDVSDNGNLDECGFYSISGENAHGVMSNAVYDRKALLLSSDKNIIGFPIADHNSSYQNNGYPVYSYRIFGYENGEFIEKGAVYSSFIDYDSSFIRGIYIGDYICALSYKEAVCIDINSMEETDRISF